MSTSTYISVGGLTRWLVTSAFCFCFAILMSVFPASDGLDKNDLNYQVYAAFDRQPGPAC